MTYEILETYLIGEQPSVVADGEKFGKRAPVVLENTSDIDFLFTDCTPPREITTLLEQLDVEVVVVEEKRLAG